MVDIIDKQLEEQDINHNVLSYVSSIYCRKTACISFHFVGHKIIQGGPQKVSHYQ